MTDRRARLERRISEIPVPLPPAGLAERIKRDIPDRLPASTPESLTDLSPYRVWVRVAAILLVVVSSTFVAMQLLVRDLAKPSVQTADVAEADMGRDVAIPPPPSMAVPSIESQPSSVEKSVDTSVRSAVLQDAAAAPPARTSPESVEARAERGAVLSSPAEEYESKKRMKVQTVTATRTADFRQTDSVDQIATANVAKEGRKNAKDDADLRRDRSATGGVAGGVVDGVAESVPVSVPEPVLSVTAQAPAVAPAAPPSLARAQSPASARRSDPSKLEVSSFYESSAGGFVDAEERAVSNFPLTVGTDSYATARASLRGGKLPSPASLRVEEFVNSFDYDDPLPSNGDFSLTSEGSVSAFPTSPRYRLIRFGIHPRLGLGTREATAEVHFNDEVVQHYRLLGYETRGHGGKDRGTAGEQVMPKSGVVALYEVKLQQNYQRRGTLATLKLSYRSASDEQVDISKDLRADEVGQAWLNARRSMQLASIAATFAEVLRGDQESRGVDLTMLAERARFVASRYPGNPAVKELVSLIETAARLKKGEAVK